MLCAYRQNIDACLGDPGGIFMGKYFEDTLYGITSWGYSCATEVFLVCMKLLQVLMTVSYRQILTTS